MMTTGNVNLVKSRDGACETVARDVTRGQAIACLRALREVEGSLAGYDLQSTTTGRPVRWTLPPNRS